MSVRVIKLTALVLTAVILLSQNVYATGRNEIGSKNISASVCVIDIPIMPLWVNTSDVRLDISFSSGKAQCSGKVVGSEGTTKITATFTLERKNSNGTYSYETSWSESVTGKTLTFSNSYAVSSGYTYRLSVSAKVTKDGITETVSTSVENKY